MLACAFSEEGVKCDIILWGGGTRVLQCVTEGGEKRGHNCVEKRDDIIEKNTIRMV